MSLLACKKRGKCEVRSIHPYYVKSKGIHILNCGGQLSKNLMVIINKGEE